MRLSLQNVAKIKSADIDIIGITVIARENATGKSTVGKALYSVFNSLYEIDEQIDSERENTFVLQDFRKKQAISLGKRSVNKLMRKREITVSESLSKWLLS